MPFVVTGENFTHRFKITVLAAKVSANETNIPVYFDLSNAPAGFWTHVKSDGGDIRITQSDGVTRQSLDIERIVVGSSVGEIHFKASSISSSVNTDFYVVYGNAGASQPAVGAAYGRNSVWSNYSGVWHMADNGNGTPGEHIDSTGNGNDGEGKSDVGTDDGPTQADAFIGKGQNFQHINKDWISCGTDSSLDITTQDFTVQFIHKFPAVDPVGFSRDTVFTYKGDLATSGWYVQRSPVSSNFSTLGLTTMHPTAVMTETNVGFFALDTTTYAHITKVGTGANNVTIYKNGADFGSYLSRGTHGNIISSSVNFQIGKYSTTTTLFYMTNLLDEIRVLKGEALSADWISTEYNNFSSPATFYTVGAEEEAAQISCSRAFIIT